MFEQYYPAINKLLFFRKRKHCPICEKDFFQFLPLPIIYENSWKKYGFPFRGKDFETLNEKEFSCPYCYASDRERFYAKYLEKRIFPDHTIQSILDIAPSPSLSSFIRKKFSYTYHTADLFMENVDFKVNIESTGFQNDQYDLIICSHVLEHVPDDKKAIKELYRVLRPGGKVIAMVPIVKSLEDILENKNGESVDSRWKYYGQDDHVRLYSKHGFVHRLQEAGFIVTEYKPGDLQIDYNKNGINPDSVLYIASK